VRETLYVDLADCTEFRQLLDRRPPRLAHGTAFLLTGLVAAALAWAALTRADLVVRAPGRVRPVSSPKRVFNPGRGEVLSASAGGRVRAVHVREGDLVRRGDVLIELDTERLDNEIARVRRKIEVAREELRQLAGVQQIAGRLADAARAKIEAEIARAAEEIRQARDRQSADVQLLERQLQDGRAEEATLRKLVGTGAAAPLELIKVSGQVAEYSAKLAKARLPVDAGPVEVLRRDLVVAEKDSAVKREELAMKRGLKEGELAAAGTELANLELERRQATLRAPADGVVVFGDVKAGDILEAGKAVVGIAEQQGFRFEAGVSSEDVAHLRVGMPARIKLDAYDYQLYGTLPGEVCFIAPDSTAAQADRPPLYTVRVEVKGEEVGRGALRGPVKLGMLGQVEIVTGRESLLSLLLKHVRQRISLG
jgi:multidrug efflux pump subunit AcrA (membrane-fusion protein)